MKRTLFILTAIFMSSLLNASGEFVRTSEFSTEYAEFLAVQKTDGAKELNKFDVKVGYSQSLLKVEDKEQKSNNLLDNIAFWVSYRF